jgi:hypothetical protein
MSFDPVNHTKEFLLTNASVAFELAKGSAEFAVHPLAQDLDVLTLYKENGWSIAHELAIERPEWALSKAAQTIEILGITDKKYGSVARCLAWMQPPWALTKAAQNLEVLSLADDFGTSIAHILTAKQPEWAKTEAARRLEILQLSNVNGVSVAHRLAKSNPAWAKTEAAQNPAVLSILTQEGLSVAHHLADVQLEWLNSEGPLSKDVIFLSHKTKGSIAEIILNKRNNKGEFLYQLAKRGIAYKTQQSTKDVLRPKFEITDIDQFIKSSSEAICDEVSVCVKLRKLVLFFATCKNLEFDIEAGDGREKLESACVFAKNQIMDLFDECPALFDDISSLHDVHCEPSMELIARVVSEKNFSQIMDVEPPAASDEPKSIQGLY